MKDDIRKCSNCGAKMESACEEIDFRFPSGITTLSIEVFHCTECELIEMDAI